MSHSGGLEIVAGASTMPTALEVFARLVDHFGEDGLRYSPLSAGGRYMCTMKRP